MRHLVVSPNRISRDIDRMFTNLLGNLDRDCCDAAAHMPRVDIRENDDNVSLVFELPGMKKDDIKVVVNNDVLTVSGERKSDNDSESNGLVRREIFAGKFSRSFTLPDSVDCDSVLADYSAGMLTVKLNKKEEVKPKEIEVRVN